MANLHARIGQQHLVTGDAGQGNTGAELGEELPGAGTRRHHDMIGRQSITTLERNTRGASRRFVDPLHLVAHAYAALIEEALGQCRDEALGVIHRAPIREQQPLVELARQCRFQVGNGLGIENLGLEAQGLAQFQMGLLVGDGRGRVEDFQDRPLAEQGLVLAGFQQRGVILVHVLGQAGHRLRDLDDLRVTGTGDEAQEPGQDARQCARTQGQRAFLVQQPGRDLFQDAGLGQRDDLAHRHLAATPLRRTVPWRGRVHQGDLVALALQVQGTADADDATTDDDRRLHGLALSRFHIAPFLPTKSPREKPSQYGCVSSTKNSARPVIQALPSMLG
ncbi:hypothetical protein D9M69_430440 [compost metagenome]